MNCPNCGKEMKDKSHMYYSIGAWDMDYPDAYHEEYWCSKCRIKYLNEEWIIPKKYERPTEKQISCTEFICRELGLDFEPVLKTQAWEFINKYFDKARKNKYNRNHSHQYYSDFEDSDYRDWIVEEF